MKWRPQNPATLDARNSYWNGRLHVAGTSTRQHERDRSSLGHFSFGCILFEAVTGKEALPRRVSDRVADMVGYEPAPLLADSNPSAPPELHRIVRRCLAKDADERYQTIKEVAIELKEVRREMKLGRN